VFDYIYYKQYGSKIFFLEFDLPNGIFNSSVSVSNARFGYSEILDFNQSLIPDFKASGPYPIAVRYIDNKYCVIERPPFQFSLDYSPTRSGYKRRNVRSVKVWAPWTIVVINHQTMSPTDIRMYFSFKPLESLDDRVIQPYFPNIYGDSRVCLGSSVYDNLRNSFGEDYTIEQLYTFFMNEYFSGGWNADIIPSSYYKLKASNSQTDYFNMNESKLKHKFYTSRHMPFDFANFVYHMSFMSLDEILHAVQNAIEVKDDYIVFPISNAIKSDNAPSSYIHPNSFYGHYSKVTLTFNNLSFNQEDYYLHDAISRREYVNNVYQFCSQYIQQDIDEILDQVYQQIILEEKNHAMINISFSIPNSLVESSANAID
jgi:hypothetical protein